MALTAERVTVSTVAVALIGLESGAVSGGALLVKNASANEAALGDSGVTASTGFRLPAGTTIQLNLPSGEQIYAIRTGGTDAVLDVIRTGG